MLRAVQRSLVALAAAGIAAAFLKARSSSAPNTPAQDGGWRELSGPELK